MYEKFSLSTSWAGDKFQNGDQLVEKYLSLGFKKIELNYSITDQMFNEVLPYVKAGKVEVTSVHHPFPKHYDEEYDTDSIMLGFLDEEKRKKAVDMTKTSIDYANRIGAKVVVIHPSEVPVSDERHYDRLLKNLYKEGKRNTQEYKKLYEEMMDHRGDSSVYVDKVVESLHELCDYIDEKGYGISLGIENRAMCHQIPDFYEAEYILTKMNDRQVYFWYDVGHGIMMESLGMFNNKDCLSRIIDKTIGVHIHDAFGVRDHFAPYATGTYLDDFVDNFKKIQVKVLEIGAGADDESVMRGADILEAAL